MEVDSFDQVKAALQVEGEQELSDTFTREEEDALMRRVAEHLKRLYSTSPINVYEPRSPYTPAAGFEGSPLSSHRVPYKKPVPYEVWRDQWGVDGAPRPAALSRKRMRQEDWQRFFQRVRQLADRRESQVQHWQHTKLADELRGLSFRPELNPHSRALVKTQRPILERQGEQTVRREEELSKQREEAKQKEMAECTFAPSLEARGRSEQYLRRAAKAGRKVDFTEFLRQKRVKRERRQQALEEAEARSLTFRPHLTRMTRHILERARREGRSGASLKRASTRGAQAGHGEGASFEPQLTARSARYTSRGGGDVHNRLYASAREKGLRTQHSSGRGLSLSRSNPAAAEAWRTGDVGSPNRSGKRKGEKGAMSPEAPVLNVVRFDPRFEGIMRRVFPWTSAWTRTGW